MKLTDEEQKICEKYSAYDEHGLVHCNECPLVINKRFCVCKANIDDVVEYFYWKRME